MHACQMRKIVVTNASQTIMKFRISKEALLEGLQKVQHVVSSRTTLPILSNVLLVAKGDRLHLTTTDLDVGITGSVLANIDKEGATTLPAKKFVTIVRELPASEVDISVDGKNIATIRCGAATFKIHGLSEAEFPPFHRPKNSKSPTAMCAMASVKPPTRSAPTRLDTCSMAFIHPSAMGK